MRDNLERLGQEKALIASGQELVAQLIQGITKRMGEGAHVFHTDKYLACLLLTSTVLRVRRVDIPKRAPSFGLYIAVVEILVFESTYRPHNWFKVGDETIRMPVVLHLYVFPSAGLPVPF